MSYIFPVAGYSGTVQTHWDGSNGASDIFAPAGTSIGAVAAGIVTKAYFDPVGGNAVLIQGEDGLTYYYAHMQESPAVRTGQSVLTGQFVGKVGNTGNACKPDANGNCTGEPHLHIGIGYGISCGQNGGAGCGFDAVAFLNEVFQSFGAIGSAIVGAITGGSSPGSSGGSGGGNGSSGGKSDGFGSITVFKMDTPFGAVNVEIPLGSEIVLGTAGVLLVLIGLYGVVMSTSAGKQAVTVVTKAAVA